jgi:hypothetical protein
MVLSNKSAPHPHLGSASSEVFKRCPYGPPRLLGEAHHCLLLLQHRASSPQVLSLHICMVLSNRSVPPQRRTPLVSKSSDFEKRRPYGPPHLLGEANRCLLLLQDHTSAPRASSSHISMVLSHRSGSPQSRAPLTSKSADFDKRCPIWAAMSAGRSTSLFVVVAASHFGPPSLELAHLHGLIKHICPTSKLGTSGL